MYSFIHKINNKWNNTNVSSVNSYNNNYQLENRKFTELNYDNNNFIVYSDEGVKNHKITIGFKENIVCVVFLLDIINKEAHLQLLDKFRKCKKNNQYPTSDDIKSMVKFCINFAKNKKMKSITLEDRASLICEKNGNRYSSCLSDYYFLKKYNSYYGFHFRFVLENLIERNIFSQDKNKLEKLKIKDIHWNNIFDKIKNDEEWEKWYYFFSKINKNLLLKQLFIKMGNNFCSLINPLIIYLLKELNISTLKGKLFIKYL